MTLRVRPYDVELDGPPIDRESVRKMEAAAVGQLKVSSKKTPGCVHPASPYWRKVQTVKLPAAFGEACSKDEERPLLTWPHVAPYGKFACDGYRLHLIEEEQGDFCPGCETAKAECPHVDHVIDTVIAQAPNVTVTIGAAELVQCLSRAAVYARENSNSVRLTASPRHGNLVVSAADKDTGGCHESIEAHEVSGRARIKVNWKYLADAAVFLSATPRKPDWNTQLVLEFRGSTSPLVLRRLSDDGRLAIVMPMHVKG